MKKPETDGSVRNEASSENVSGKLKKVKYGSMSLITIALVIALVVIFNAMASYMVKRSPLKIDLTADKRYELSDESINFLKNDLDKDIDIVVTCQRSEFDSISDYVESLYLRYAGVSIDCPFDMIPILLDKYEMYANQGKGKISLRYVDLDKDPTAVKKYSDAYGEEIKAQSMVIACGDRVRVIDRDGIGGMISPDLSDQTKPKLVFAGESRITSEIMNVVDANPITVAFASKVNGQPIYSTSCEDSVTGLRDQLLTKNGYFCTDVDLLNDELDTEKFDMVVIPMPSVDFDKSVIEKLTNFLMNDGNYDKNLLFVDDSIVRGTQLRETVEFLYANGAKSVHMRSACPPLMFTCKYLNFSREKSDMELITRRVILELEGEEGFKHLDEYSDGSTERGKKMREVICEKFHFASLDFQSLDNLIEAIGLPRCDLCTYCWNGKE